MIRSRCTRTKGCRRMRMKGSDACFPCARTSHRTPPQVAARQIAAVTGDHSDLEEAAE